jgi:shikimate kinase
MAVLGRGEGHGGISILHALGAGYGAAASITLSTRVQLRDTPVKREPEDPHGLISTVVETWSGAGLPIPESEELHWAIRSDLPIGRGLKSSAALAVACIRALADATDTQLENHQIVDIASSAQLACGCSLTGSVDDSWAAVEPGWKVVDPSSPAADGVLMQGEIEDSDKWTILILNRGPRELQPDPERFQAAAGQFQQAITAVEQEQIFNAMIHNGRAVSSALGDSVGRKTCNDMGILGCRVSAISGSGPSIALILPSSQESSIRRVYQTIEPRGWEILETAFRSSEA